MRMMAGYQISGDRFKFLAGLLGKFKFQISKSKET